QQNFIAVRRGQNRLTQTKPAMAQFALHLKPMQLERNLEIFEETLAEQHTVVAFHVEQLDRKHIRRATQLFESKDQRRRVALAYPPCGSLVKVFELDRTGTLDDAKNVQVRVLGEDLACDGGAVQHDRAQVIVRRRFQAFDQFS